MPLPYRPNISRGTLAGPIACLVLAACSPAPSPLPDEMRSEFKPGMPLEEAKRRLQARNTTFSVKSAEECQAQVERNANAGLLRPRGGPCVFGKIAGSRDGLFSGRSDVILQLVFDPASRMVDGQFEEIHQPF